MTSVTGEYLLDEPDGIEAADPSGMLRAVAGAPAQFRQATETAYESGLDAAAEGGRPRAVVVAGMGGSGIAGDVLAAVAGPGAPAPVVAHRGYGLPGWVGSTDVVVAVSCSGRTEETLSAAEEAVRRGARIVTVGAADSPLADLGARGRGVHVPVPGGRPPRASLWALSVPLVVLGDALRVCHVSRADLDDAADLLDQLTERYKAGKESFLNPAKGMAIAFADTLPLVWGTSPLAGVAAYRAACQFNENAKRPAVWGVLPEANHNQVVTFDGAGADERVRLLFLRDSDERPEVARRVDLARELAAERGIGADEVVAEGDSPVARLASLVAAVDFMSTYLALMLGVDPTAIRPIDELKRRAAE